MKTHLLNKATAVILFGLLISVSGISVAVQAQDMGAIDVSIFKSADLNHDGKISRREILHYGDLVFLSMDVDNNDTLTLEEFIQWDPGYFVLANEIGKTSQFNAAKQGIFKIRDINNSGSIEHDEFSTFVLYDFYKADTDRNSFLSQHEFINEYRMLKSLRAVISNSSEDSIKRK